MNHKTTIAVQCALLFVWHASTSPQKIKPYHALAYVTLSEQLKTKQQYEKAQACAWQALAMDPAHVETRILLGELLMNQNHYKKAVQQFDQALVAEPTERTMRLRLANNLLLLGNHLYRQHDIEQALHRYQQIIALFPNSAAVLHNIGFSLAELNRPHEAVKAYEKALSIRPDLVETHFSLSTAYLATGEYTKGWEAYEWRWQKKNKSLEDLPYPLWDGSDAHGQTILLRSEGALGDTMQFVRYAQLIKQRGATIVLHTLSPLKKLFSLCDYIDTVVTDQDPLPLIDTQISLMSLPYLFGSTVQTVPHDVPYLHANEQLIQQWHTALFDNNYYNVGICWQADVHNDKQRPPLARRTIPVNLFAPMAKLPGVRLFSLQKLNNAQPKNVDFALYQFGPDFDAAHGRFMDTAAVIKNLDLVISVDTSVAHLAGALGITTWVILPFKSDWRWMVDRNDSPWYPSMTLFRNKKTICWESVMHTVMQKLKQISAP